METNGQMDENTIGNIEIILKSIVISIFILSGIIGNSSVIHAIRTYPKLRTVPNYFVFNLAVADLLFSLTGMVMILITTVSKGWVLGVKMCNFGGLLNSVFCTTSIWTLVMISLHRYFAVSKPMLVKRVYTKRRTLMMIVCIWIFAFLISVPPLFGWSQFVEGTNFCTVDGRKNMSYSIFLLMTDYFFPFLFLSGLYLRIFFVLKKHENTMKRHKSVKPIPDLAEVESEIMTADEAPKSPNLFSSPSEIRAADTKRYFEALQNKAQTDGVVTNLNSPVRESTETLVIRQNEENNNKIQRNGKRHISFCDDSNQKIGKSDSTKNPNGIIKATLKRTKTGSKRKKFFKEVKVTKMLLIVVCGFFLCWTPFLVAGVLYAFNAVPSDLKLLTIGIYFACLNSCLNPFIYGVMNTNFRYAFQTMARNFLAAVRACVNKDKITISKKDGVCRI
uniref:GPCR16 n=1 Tax=Clytia hemisphaerica TaxID=252671 RepID=A0A4P2T111_9CNID|nr:GPCR16 [Clytia hemisphaerica]